MEYFSFIEYASYIRSTESSWRYLKDDEIKIFSTEDFNNKKTLSSIKKELLTKGFLILECSDIISSLHKNVFSYAKDFFYLPLNIKKELSFDKIDQKKYGNVGYFPFNTEKAVKHKVHDLKEFIHFGQGNSLKNCYPGNPWLKDYPFFKDSLRAEYYALNSIGNLLFPLIGQMFGLDEKYLIDLIHNNNSTFRVLHYPKVEMRTDEAMRAAPHHGMNLMGFQPLSTHHGLQFCTVDSNEWVAIPDKGKQLISVNIGRMFSYLTNGQLRPTLHRVINSQEQSEKYSRYTGVLFYHANPTKYLKPILGNEALQEVLVGDWLLGRLNSLGISK